MYDYFVKNKLLVSCQSGFIKGDSRVSQLLEITEFQIRVRDSRIANHFLLFANHFLLSGQKIAIHLV